MLLFFPALVESAVDVWSEEVDSSASAPGKSIWWPPRGHPPSQPPPSIPWCPQECETSRGRHPPSVRTPTQARASDGLSTAPAQDWTAVMGPIGHRRSRWRTFLPFLHPTTILHPSALRTTSPGRLENFTSFVAVGCRQWTRRVTPSRSSYDSMHMLCNVTVCG